MSRKVRSQAISRILMPALCLLLFFIAEPVAAADTVAVKSSQPIYVDNTFVEMSIYNINGNNYVRLRDIGQVVGFNVIYDADSRSIHIKTDEPYGGEVSTTGQAPETAQVSQTIQTIYIDSNRTYISAYNIGGNNYVKLVDLGSSVGFDVSWDSSDNRVLVNALRPYVAQTPSAEPILAPAKTPETPAMTIDEMIAEIVRLTNEARVEEGLPELEIHPELMETAQTKAKDMVDNNYLNHISPTYGTPGNMIWAAIPQAGKIGENAAYFSESRRTVPEEAVNSWSYSDEHRKNMFSTMFTHIGVGVLKDKKGNYYCVQHFAQMP